MLPEASGCGGERFQGGEHWNRDMAEFGSEVAGAFPGGMDGEPDAAADGCSLALRLLGTVYHCARHLQLQVWRNFPGNGADALLSEDFEVLRQGDALQVERNLTTGKLNRSPGMVPKEAGEQNSS